MRCLPGFLKYIHGLAERSPVLISKTVPCEETDSVGAIVDAHFHDLFDAELTDMPHIQTGIQRGLPLSVLTSSLTTFFTHSRSPS